MGDTRKRGGANIGIGIQKKYAKNVNLKTKADEFFPNSKVKLHTRVVEHFNVWQY